MSTPESLFEQLVAQQQHKRLPPVEKWHPDRVGHSQMRIAADGRWFYQGSEIHRVEMVKLFSTVLRRDGDVFFLVTPAERLEIDVDDAPFVAVDMEAKGEGPAQEIAFRTNVDDVIVADAEHPITVKSHSEGMRPYVHVRRGLDARISRPVYYRLAELIGHPPKGGGAADKSIAGVWSCRSFFELGRLDA
jgi:uncharacterized protein